MPIYFQSLIFNSLKTKFPKINKTLTILFGGYVGLYSFLISYSDNNSFKSIKDLEMDKLRMIIS